MHRRKKYRKPVMTKLPASVGITTTGDVGMTGANRGEMTAAILVAVVAVVQDAVISARSAGRVVAEAIASVASAAEEAVTGIAIPVRANCLSRRKECA